MGIKNESSAADRIRNILAESQQFRDECKKHIKRSRGIHKFSVKLTEEIQEFSEEAAILIEEKIMIKEKGLAILKLGYKEKKIDEMSPVYSSIKEEEQVVLEMHERLKIIPIAKENFPLLKLREMFFNLSFISNE